MKGSPAKELEGELMLQGTRRRQIQQGNLTRGSSLVCAHGCRSREPCNRVRKHVGIGKLWVGSEGELRKLVGAHIAASPTRSLSKPVILITEGTVTGVQELLQLATEQSQSLRSRSSDSQLPVTRDVFSDKTNTNWHQSACKVRSVSVGAQGLIPEQVAGLVLAVRVMWPVAAAR